MAEQRVLDLGRIDALAARPDHVLHPVMDEDIAVLVPVRSVTGAHPSLAHRSRASSDLSHRPPRARSTRHPPPPPPPPWLPPPPPPPLLWGGARGPRDSA